jgi:hypothetical protein
VAKKFDTFDVVTLVVFLFGIALARNYDFGLALLITLWFCGWLAEKLL